mgnify:CR=1 FL=1
MHIKDMVEAYLVLLDAPKNLVGGNVYNAGYENHSVRDIANMVKDEVGQDVKLEFVPTDDNRSYHVSSKKIYEELGFRASHGISEAVRDLCKAFENNDLVNPLENEMYFNIKRMNSINIKVS